MNEDKFILEDALMEAKSKDSLTLGECIALMLLTEGKTPFNNNPGVFAGMIPLEG